MHSLPTQSLSPTFFRVLIILNGSWAVAALLYDWNALLAIPLWALPFIVICPLYPLLLAGIWTAQLYKYRLSAFIAGPAIVGSATFGMLAYLFYPMVMLNEGFTWNSLGQILWVTMYGLQGAWLLVRYPLSRWTFYTGISWTLTSLLVLYLTKSYGYLGFEILPASWQNGLLLGALGCLFLAATMRKSA